MIVTLPMIAIIPTTVPIMEITEIMVPIMVPIMEITDRITVDQDMADISETTMTIPTIPAIPITDPTLTHPATDQTIPITDPTLTHPATDQAIPITDPILDLTTDLDLPTNRPIILDLTLLRKLLAHLIPIPLTDLDLPTNRPIILDLTHLPILHLMDLDLPTNPPTLPPILPLMDLDLPTNLPTLPPILPLMDPPTRAARRPATRVEGNRVEGDITRVVNLPLARQNLPTRTNSVNKV